MSLATSRQQRRQLALESSKLPRELVEIPRDGWPAHLVDPQRLRVWRSRFFLVQEFTAPAPAVVRLSVNRTQVAGERWADGISWDDLQQIKNDVGYFAHTAVEIYPSVADVVNVANMRHLWIVAERPEFVWTRSSRFAFEAVGA
jgi:hypothetical protein